MSNEKKNTNIAIQIKFGKYMTEARFNVFYANGLIMCLSMWIGKEEIYSESREKYFLTNYKNIKKQFHIQHGEIA